MVDSITSGQKPGDEVLTFYIESFCLLTVFMAFFVMQLHRSVAVFPWLLYMYMYTNLD